MVVVGGVGGGRWGGGGGRGGGGGWGDVCVLRLRGCWCVVGACLESVWCVCLFVQHCVLRTKDMTRVNVLIRSLRREGGNCPACLVLSCFCSAVPLLVSSLVGLLISHRTNDTNIDTAELGRGLWEHDRGRDRLSFNSSCCEDV